MAWNPSSLLFVILKCALNAPMCYYLCRVISGWRERKLHLLPFRVIGWLALPQSRDVSARTGRLPPPGGGPESPGCRAQRAIASPSSPLPPFLVLSFFLFPLLTPPLPKLRAPFCFSICENDTRSLLEEKSEMQSGNPKNKALTSHTQVTEDTQAFSLGCMVFCQDSALSIA